MLSGYIIDDDPFSIKALEVYIDRMPELVLLKSFANPLLALEEIRLAEQPDIVFLVLYLHYQIGVHINE